MHMGEKEWEKAQTDFFEAFKSYDEAGSPQRISCLKYLVLANMLMESQINPFDSQETKPYKNDAQIEAMTNLVNAYQRKDIKEFEKILRGQSASEELLLLAYLHYDRSYQITRPALWATRLFGRTSTTYFETFGCKFWSVLLSRIPESRSLLLQR